MLRTFQAALTKEQGEFAYQNVKMTRRGNPVTTKKTYWFNVYSKILQQSRYMFVVQNNNITASKYNALKLELRANKIECLSVQNSLFSAAAVSQKQEGLVNLFQGQTLLFFSNASDTESPTMVQDIGKISTKYNKNILLMGGSIDRFVISADTFNDVKKLPPKIVLYGQLLGLIGHPGSAITSTLAQTPQLLTSSLEQYSKDQTPE